MRTVLIRFRPMFVCICHGVTDRDIRRAAADGVREVHELTMRLGLGSGCGSCRDEAAAVLAEARVLPLPVLRAA